MATKQTTLQFNSETQSPIEGGWQDSSPEHFDPEEPINLTISPPRDSATMEWLNMPADAISFQQPTQEHLEEEIFDLRLKESQSFNPEEENDIVMENSPSPTNHREDKHSRRRIKNEKNYRDLNRSLANLGRTTRDSSYDNNTWTCHSQSHTQTETFKSPFLIPKIISSTPKYSKTEFNTPTSLFPKKNQSNQNSPRHNDNKLFELPDSHKPYDSLKTPPKEPVHIKSTNITPKGGLLAPSNSYYSLDMGVKPKDNKQLKEEKIFGSPWEKRGSNFLPGPNSNGNTQFSNRLNENTDSIRFNKTEKHEISRPKIFAKDKRVPPATLNYSFRDIIGMKEQRQILDSPLPSKAELSEKSSAQDVQGPYFMHAKFPSSGGLPNQKSSENSFSKTKPMPKHIESPPKIRPQEEGAFSPLEKEALEACKTDLLSIKKDIEERQKNYNEVDKFFNTLRSNKLKKSADDISPRSSGRTKREDIRLNSTFSAANISRNGIYEPRSSHLLPTESLTPDKVRKQNGNRSGLVSFDMGLTYGFSETQILNKSLQDERKSPDFKNRENVGYYYFESKPTETKTDPNSASTKPSIYQGVENQKQPPFNPEDQSSSCNMF